MKGVTSIYFIKCKDGQNEYIKIGHAKNVSDRLSSLQTGNPLKLELFAVIWSAFMELERELHDMFRKYHISGEWFRYDKSMQDYIDGLNDEEEEEENINAWSEFFLENEVEE